MSHESFPNKLSDSSESKYEDDSLMPEVSNEIASTFEDISYPTVLACADDRECTPASAEYLKGLGLPMDYPYLRYFGGKFGVSRVALVTIAAQYGESRLTQALNGGYFGFTEDLSIAAKENGVLLASHSAESAEENPVKIVGDIDKDIACAYAAGLGAVTNLSAENQLSIRVAEFESHSLFGHTESNHNFEAIVTANKLFMSAALGDETKDFKITRRDLIRTKTPTMLLRGSHAPSEQAKHVLNLTKDKVSNPQKANHLGVPYYNNDVCHVAKLIISSLPELQLDPAVLLDVILLDESATRTALAAMDGPADPQRLQSQHLGDPVAALDFLSSL